MQEKQEEIEKIDRFVFEEEGIIKRQKRFT